MRITCQRQPLIRLVVFAAGDFAFNLYWQSVMLFLLFYYTDTLGISMEVAAAMYLAASLWEGAIGLVIGIFADRHRSERLYRRVLVIGGPSLGVSFVLAYLPPRWPGEAGVIGLFLCHLLFRTAYALVNVPYLAMSARISEHSADRAMVAGLRMLAGTAAAVVVALVTIPLGTFMSGSKAQAFVAAATLFAAIGGLLLMLLGATYRDAVPARKFVRVPLRMALAALGSNRAFVTLAAAMMAMIVAITTLSKSVLYYFKYFVHDEAAGQLALAAMMAVSGASGTIMDADCPAHRSATNLVFCERCGNRPACPVCGHRRDPRGDDTTLSRGDSNRDRRTQFRLVGDAARRGRS